MSGIYSNAFQTTFEVLIIMEANTMSPDQTTFKGAV